MIITEAAVNLGENAAKAKIASSVQVIFALAGE